MSISITKGSTAWTIEDCDHVFLGFKGDGRDDSMNTANSKGSTPFSKECKIGTRTPLSIPLEVILDSWSFDSSWSTAPLKRSTDLVRTCWGLMCGGNGWGLLCRGLLCRGTDLMEPGGWSADAPVS